MRREEREREKRERKEKRERGREGEKRPFLLLRPGNASKDLSNFVEVLPQLIVHSLPTRQEHVPLRQQEAPLRVSLHVIHIDLRLTDAAECLIR